MNWFKSLSGAITLSFGALLIELFRAFLDFAIIYPNELKGMEIIVALVYAVIFGVWGAGLLAARGGNRSGMMATLIVGLVFWLGLDWTTMLPILCPNGCASIWFYIASLADLVVGGLAAVAWILQLRKKEFA